MSRIMLHGNAPWVPSAYGQQLRLLGKQLRGLGHEVAFSANWGLQGAGMNYEGLQVFPAADGNSQHGCSLLPGHVDAWKADLVIALGDAWYWPAAIMSQLPCPLALWMPIDCSPLGSMDNERLQQLPNAHIIAMSMHGVEELLAAGHKATFIPHAYSPEIFYPHTYDGERRTADRTELGIEPGTFAIGICAANKDGCRKGFGEQFRAFAAFHDNHPDSRLLVHAVPDKSQGGLNLRQLADLVGITGHVSFPSSYALDCGLYSPAAMASWYNAIDLLSACSWGEGFGVPAIEAQACGTPVVVTNFAAQATLPAWRRVSADRWMISAHDAWWGRPNVADLTDAYEDAFHNWQAGDMDGMRDMTVASAQFFQAGHVAQTYWRPWLSDVLGQGDAR